MARQRAEAGTGSIHQDAIEAAPQLRSLLGQARRIAMARGDAAEPQPLAVALHPPQARLAAIQRQHEPLIPHGLG